ncbi:MAG TPA: Crp/Fnr family transcriptional regulator [Terriglobia bacterium]|nr:Crp/Fnr family transcriptional regulator [Terriglobia bacterium]
MPIPGLVKLAGPYGLKVIGSCLTCVMREEGIFCRLSPEALHELNSIRRSSFYPQGAVLFVDGESPRGLFILCSGQAKLAASSREGKAITLRQAERGEVLGLSSVIAGEPYPVMAETLVPCEVNFIPGPEFLRFIRNHADVALRVAEHLSMELHKAWAQAKLLALAPNARAKLAQLILAWGAGQGKPAPEGLRVPFNMTREEIGENIDATRETVTRLLSDFRRRGFIRIKGGAILLLRPDCLRTLLEQD